jgi:hypothetical protein
VRKRPADAIALRFDMLKRKREVAEEMGKRAQSDENAGRSLTGAWFGSQAVQVEVAENGADGRVSRGTGAQLRPEKKKPAEDDADVINHAHQLPKLNCLPAAADQVSGTEILDGEKGLEAQPGSTKTTADQLEGVSGLEGPPEAGSTEMPSLSEAEPLMPHLKGRPRTQWFEMQTQDVNKRWVLKGGRVLEGPL